MESCHYSDIQKLASSLWSRNVPKLPPHPDFIIQCKQPCVFKPRRASEAIVSSERMQLARGRGPCEVGVYLPVCGHPGFMAVIQ